MTSFTFISFRRCCCLRFVGCLLSAENIHVEDTEKVKERLRMQKIIAAEEDRLRKSSSLRDSGKRQRDESEDKSLLTNINFEVLTVEEIQQARQIQKERFLGDEKALWDEILALQQKTGGIFLGRDRAFRKYWAFRSLPGVLVEQEQKDFIGSCLGHPTPLHCIDTVKENTDVSKLSGNIFANMMNGVFSPNDFNKEADPSNSDYHCLADSDDNSGANSLPIYQRLLACTGDESTCPVHNIEGVKWWWFDGVDKLSQLIAACNPRGIREMDLLENVKSCWSSLSGFITSCPLAKPLSVAKMSADFSTSSLLETFELTLRDTLLEIEERIYLGSLGNLKVSFVNLKGFYCRQCLCFIWFSSQHVNMEFNVYCRLEIAKLGDMILSIVGFHYSALMFA